MVKGLEEQLGPPGPHALVRPVIAGPRWNVVNVVGTMNLDQKIDLERLGRLRYAKFDADLYPAAYVKTNDMIGRVTIFNSGKLISVGTTSVSRAEKESLQVIDYIARERIVRPTRPAMKVQNIVAVFDIGTRIEIGRYVKDTPCVIYEPEQFPGVIHWLRDPKLTTLLFESGKGVLAGAKSTKEMTRGLSEVFRTIEQYRVGVELHR